MPKVVLRSGVNIHYQQIGEGPDLVMIHGLTGNLSIWHLNIVPQLWDNFRILTYDLRGHGYSAVTPSGYSPDEMAADLRDLLDALEIERPYVVGHSFGADVALYFALNYPERVERVAAIEAALPALVHLRDREDWAGWDHWADALERAGHPVPPERRTDVLYLMRMSVQVPKQWGPLNGVLPKPERFRRLMDETSMPEDSQRVGTLTLDRIADISTPVTLIYSENSPFLGTYHYLAGRLPRVDPVVLPDTLWGHFGPMEVPDLVSQYLVSAFTPPGSAARVGSSDRAGSG